MHNVRILKEIGKETRAVYFDEKKYEALLVKAKKRDLDLQYILGTAKESFLHFAVLEDNVKAAKMLIKFGADIEAKDVDGETPLMYTYKPKMAKVLLKNGADIEAKDNDGWSVFTHATRNGRNKVVKLLLSTGEIKNKEIKKAIKKTEFKKTKKILKAELEERRKDIIKMRSKVLGGRD